MNNRVKTILIAAVVSSVVLTQGVCVSAAQFDDGASAFSDGTGSVSALASTLASRQKNRHRSLWRRKRKLHRSERNAEWRKRRKLPKKQSRRK